MLGIEPRALCLLRNPSTYWTTSIAWMHTAPQRRHNLSEIDLDPSPHLFGSKKFRVSHSPKIYVSNNSTLCNTEVVVFILFCFLMVRTAAHSDKQISYYNMVQIHVHTTRTEMETYRKTQFLFMVYFCLSCFIFILCFFKTSWSPMKRGVGLMALGKILCFLHPQPRTTFLIAPRIYLFIS